MADLVDRLQGLAPLSAEEVAEGYLRLRDDRHCDEMLRFKDDVLVKLVRSLLGKSSPSSSLSAADRSQEWASNTFKPLASVPKTVPEMKRALETPLLERIPVSQTRYKECESNLGVAGAKAAFYSPEEYVAEEVSGITSLVLGYSMDLLALDSSESVWESVFDLAFIHFWNVWLKLKKVVGFSANRNVADPTGTTIKAMRPDLLVWLHNRLGFKVEHKRDASEIAAAWKDLFKKMNSLDPMFYGPMQWIVGMATAGPMYRIGVFKVGDCEYLTDNFGSLNSFEGRVEILRLSINILRILITWAPVFSSLPMIKAWEKRPTVCYGPDHKIVRELRVEAGVPIKVFGPWKTHQEAKFTTEDYLVRAYSIRSPYVVGGKVSFLRTLCRIEMDTLGMDLRPNQKTIVQAVEHILLGLRDLHKAGLVHRDLRWPNVLWSPKNSRWFIIDLETVWETDHVPGFPVAETDALVQSRYTFQSDLLMLGKMMYDIDLTPTNPAHLDFASKLLRKSFTSARAALEEWRSINNLPQPVFETGFLN